MLERAITSSGCVIVFLAQAMHQLSTVSDHPRALLAAISAPLVARLLQYLAATCTERLVETTFRELGDIFSSSLTLTVSKSAGDHCS